MDQVAFKEVSFSYNGVFALRNISFTLKKGDFVGVIGPNGSGKSTLLKLVEGIIRPESGQISFGDKHLSDHQRRELAQAIAIVPQHFNLDFNFKASEVIKMGRYARRGRTEPAFDLSSLLDKLEIAHLKERFFPQLSGGEKQMVVLAQALAQQPELLLLDEPAAHLDVSHQLRLFQLLKQVNQDGITVLCVIHDLNLALLYFDQLLLLSEGKMISFGPAASVLDPRKLESVYGVKAYVHRHAGRVFLTFSPRFTGEEKAKIHVVCGGGTGSFLLRKLVDLGFSVSVGVINALDTDEVTGRELGLPMAVEAPFTSITDEVFGENLKLIERADLVILTDVPIGFGNVKNLEAIRKALEMSKPVWVSKSLGELDFTGEVKEMISDLVDLRYYANIDEIVEEMEKKWGK